MLTFFWGLGEGTLFDRVGEFLLYFLLMLTFKSMVTLRSHLLSKQLPSIHAYFQEKEHSASMLTFKRRNTVHPCLLSREGTQCIHAYFQEKGQSKSMLTSKKRDRVNPC
jgi:hypothetical protein